MRYGLAMRGALVLTVCGAASGLAQKRPESSKPAATLPQTNTTSPATLTAAYAPVQPVVPLTPAQKPARRAEVNFAQGQLAITADNASLNQILREIGRQTGISITGGVAEERVFGKYGPAPTQDVLALLLDGTGSNLILVPGEGGGAGQLILTPRQGGVTPPNPNAPGFDDDSGDNDGINRFRPPNQGVSIYGEMPGVQGGAPANGAPGNGTPQNGFPTNGFSGPTADPSNPGNATAPQTPNGIKTPQEIMQQLQLLRQQQQQQTPPEPN